MGIEPSSVEIERRASAQARLAALAEADEVRAMHEELEQFHRTQLVAMALAERLAAG